MRGGLFLGCFTPQALNVPVADRRHAQRRAPFGNSARCEEGIFVGPPRRVLRRDRLDIARCCAVQGEMGDARGKLFDELAVAGLDGFGGNRQRAANVVDDRQPDAFEHRDCRVVALRVGREADLAGQDRNEP